MLTLAQRRTYQFIQKFFAEHGYAPTTAEIALGTGIKSKGVAHRYVQALVAAGLLDRIPNRRRNLLLTAKSETQSTHTIPLVGAIAAGSPIEAIPEQECLDVQSLLGGPERYALRVKGDSMVNEGIFDGDIVICERCETAVDGAIVVALIDGQDATLKRLRRNDDDTITLLPANAHLSPLVYTAARVQIQGRFIGLLRLNG